MTTVDAVIVSFNSAEHLRACVAAFRAWPRAGQVIVVDNGSTDGSVAVARSIADIVLTPGQNLGFGAGQNLGVEHATTTYVLLLNPDAEVDPCGLESGYCALEKHPGAGAVQGRVLRAQDGMEERWQGAEPGVQDLMARLLRLRERFGEERLQRWSGYVGAGYYRDRGASEPASVEFLAAVAPLVRRAAFEQVGGFDPAFFLYAEDIDLARRLRAASWELIALPVNWVVHAGGASSRDRVRWREKIWWQSHLTLVERHWGGWRRLIGLLLCRIGARGAGRVG